MEGAALVTVELLVKEENETDEDVAMQVKMFIKKELSTLEEISVMEELLLLGEIPVKEEKEDSMPDAISVKKEPPEQDSDKQQPDVLNRNEGTTPICCAPTCLHQENSQFRFFCFPYSNPVASKYSDEAKSG